jgi:AraC family transcriptional activator FtrA
MVTPPHRQTGQAQFIPMPLGASAGDGLAPVLDWARSRLNKPLRVADLADRAAMSERNFLRRFSAQVGLGPKEWLRGQRVAAAQALLERSSQRLEAVAQAVGFGSASALRAAFRATIGVPPTLHWRQFGAPPGS